MSKEYTYPNGIKSFPFTQNQCRRDMRGVAHGWLAGFDDITPLQASILNDAASHHFSGGGTEFNIDFVRAEYSVLEIYEATINLMEMGAIKKIDEGLYDYNITTDELFNIAPPLHYKSIQKHSKVPDQSACFIYILHNGFHYKVGISNSIDRRIKELMTASSLPVVEAFKVESERWKCLKVERAVHKEFADTQTNGEWFDANLKDLEMSIQSHLMDLEAAL